MKLGLCRPCVWLQQRPQGGRSHPRQSRRNLSACACFERRHSMSSRRRRPVARWGAETFITPTRHVLLARPTSMLDRSARLTLTSSTPSRTHKLGSMRSSCSFIPFMVFTLAWRHNPSSWDAKHTDTTAYTARAHTCSSSCSALEVLRSRTIWFCMLRIITSVCTRCASSPPVATSLRAELGSSSFATTTSSSAPSALPSFDVAWRILRRLRILPSECPRRRTCENRGR